MGPMYYIGLDVHKKKISYCVKDGSGQVHREGENCPRTAATCSCQKYWEEVAARSAHSVFIRHDGPRPHTPNAGRPPWHGPEREGFSQHD
jgi:hypothetical protein